MSASNIPGSRRPRRIPVRRRRIGSCSAHIPTITSRGWASARCPSSTTGARPCVTPCTPGRRPSFPACCTRQSRATMYAGPAAILPRWLQPPFAVDGWRIDVANMLGRLGADQLGHDVARSIRAAVKTASPEAYLIGEHWFDAIDQLAGDQWDGVMDYAGFTQPLTDWLEGITCKSHGAGTVF